jgi:hypothetical protein
MLDNKTVGLSIAGLFQVIALSKLDPTILVNYFIARNHRIKFSAGKALFLGTIQVDT